MLDIFKSKKYLINILYAVYIANKWNGSVKKKRIVILRTWVQVMATTLEFPTQFGCDENCKLQSTANTNRVGMPKLQREYQHTSSKGCLETYK